MIVVSGRVTHFGISCFFGDAQHCLIGYVHALRAAVRYGHFLSIVSVDGSFVFFRLPQAPG